jgi:hypothetical protein
MPHRPKKSKKIHATPGTPGIGQDPNHQFLDHRRRAMATRSTLSRLRNRKSDLK